MASKEFNEVNNNVEKLTEDLQVCVNSYVRSMISVRDHVRLPRGRVHESNREGGHLSGDPLTLFLLCIICTSCSSSF